jgi:hypothetical protein
VLEDAFQRTHYPDVNIVDRLANMLQLNTERISVWFQNRRARFKKLKKQVKDEICDEENENSQHESILQFLDMNSMTVASRQPSNNVPHMTRKTSISSIKENDDDNEDEDEVAKNEIENNHQHSHNRTEQAVSVDYQHKQPVNLTFEQPRPMITPVLPPPFANDNRHVAQFYQGTKATEATAVSDYYANFYQGHYYSSVKLPISDMCSSRPAVEESESSSNLNPSSRDSNSPASSVSNISTSSNSDVSSSDSAVSTDSNISNNNNTAVTSAAHSTVQSTINSHQQQYYSNYETLYQQQLIYHHQQQQQQQTVSVNQPAYQKQTVAPSSVDNDETSRPSTPESNSPENCSSASSPASRGSPNSSESSLPSPHSLSSSSAALNEPPSTAFTNTDYTQMQPMQPSTSTYSMPNGSVSNGYNGYSYPSAGLYNQYKYATQQQQQSQLQQGSYHGQYYHNGTSQYYNHGHAANFYHQQPQKGYSHPQANPMMYQSQFQYSYGQSYVPPSVVVKVESDSVQNE